MLPSQTNHVVRRHRPADLLPRPHALHPHPHRRFPTQHHPRRRLGRIRPHHQPELVRLRPLAGPARLVVRADDGEYDGLPGRGLCGIDDDGEFCGAGPECHGRGDEEREDRIDDR